MIEAGQLRPGQIPPEAVTEGLIALSASQREMALDGDSRVYLNTPSFGYVPLQPGTLVEGRYPDNSGSVYRVWQYVDGNRQLQDVPIQPDKYGFGKPTLPDVTQERLARFSDANHNHTEAIQDALHPQPAPIAPVHEAWIIDHNADEVVGAAAQAPVWPDVESGTMNEAGEFVAYVDPLVAAAANVRREDLRPDLQFTLGDQIALNARVGAEEVIEDLERIVNAAAAEITREIPVPAAADEAALPTEGEVSFDQLMDVGAANNNERTQVISAEQVQQARHRRNGGRERLHRRLFDTAVAAGSALLAPFATNRGRRHMNSNNRAYRPTVPAGQRATSHRRAAESMPESEHITA
jgi:hypothetical protein